MPAARFAVAIALGALALGACSDRETPEASGTGAAAAPAADAGTASTAGSPDTPVTGTASPESTATAAAGTSAPEDVDSNPPSDGCGASRVAPFASLTATPKVRADVAAKVGHDRIRWLTPDSVVTMDFRADRLNVDLDKANVIIKGRCG